MKILSLLRKYRIAVMLSGIALLLILILLCLVLSTTKMFPRPELRPDDWMRQSRITMRVMQEVFRSGPEDRTAMKFSEQDVRSLLRFAVNQDQLRGIFTGKDSAEEVPFRADYADGSFIVDWIAWPAAGPFRFILHVKARIAYADNRFQAENASGSIGRLPIPQFILMPVTRKIFRMIEQDPVIRNFHPAVESIAVSADHGIVVDFRPHLLKDAVRGSFAL